MVRLGEFVEQVTGENTNITHLCDVARITLGETYLIHATATGREYPFTDLDGLIHSLRCELMVTPRYILHARVVPRIVGDMHAASARIMNDLALFPLALGVAMLPCHTNENILKAIPELLAGYTLTGEWDIDRIFNLNAE